MDVDEGGWAVSATDSQLERERDGFLEILTDLIEELWDFYMKITQYGVGGVATRQMIYRAESRLREVVGDE